MCIVIDTNTIVSIFDPSNQAHEQFKPILDWIISGKGKIVIGGTRYRHEIFFGIKKYNRLLKHLLRMRKVVEISDPEVDAAETRIRSLEPSSDFDDAHILALLDVSGCMLICSKDKRAYPFLKKMELYASRKERPKIYESLRNEDLLCEANIAPCCEPKVHLKKVEQDAVAAFLTH